MVSFENKKISDYENLAAILVGCREERGESLEDISRILNIRMKYLEALESGNYSELPHLTYTKNFLKSYSKYLGLDSHILEGILMKEVNIYQKSYSKKTPISLKSEETENVSLKCKSIILPKIGKVILIIFLILSFGFYMVFQVRKIFSPPNLVLYFPQDNYVTSDPSLRLEGKSTKESTVLINGKLILVDDKGEFSEEIPLQLGMNIVKIASYKKYSKEKIVLRKIMYVDDSVVFEEVAE